MIISNSSFLFLPYNMGDWAYKPVVRLFRNETKEWYHVFVEGEAIVCTGGHPFYVAGKGFIEARKLKVSEKLLLSYGKEVIIEKVEVERLAEAETTYNFEIEDFHTYYVSEKAVLVHNICNKEAEKVAKELGYSKVKGQQSHGQAIFTNKKAPLEVRYITADYDGHNGGFWKGASSIEKLGSKATRSGTYDRFLRRIGD